MNNLRFSVNRRQIAMLIFGLLILSLLTLSTNALKDNAKSYDETIFSAENSATSIDLVQRESLALTTRFAQWRAGEIERRVVQITRANLAQRLNVITSSNTADGEKLGREYFATLKVGDKILAQGTPGYITSTMQKNTAEDSIFFIENFMNQSRIFSSNYRSGLDAIIMQISKQRKDMDRLNLILLLIFGLNGILFVSSLIYTSNKRYRFIRNSISEQLILLEDANLDLLQSQNLVDKLQALDIRKNDFITTINHELRTPLTSIIGYVSLLQKNIGSGTNENNLKLLNVIDRNSNILLDLVEEILTLSSLSQSHDELIKTKVDLYSVISDCVISLAPQSLVSEVEIVVTQEDGTEAFIDANSVQISQAIFNILSNALKFSPPHSQVKLAISQSRDHSSQKTIKIIIADQGMGIPDSEVGEIFNSFYRASNTKDKAIPGSGLGLAITLKIIRLHEGRIEVNSIVGVGTTFTLFLPAHLNEVDKMIIDRADGVLERAISALRVAPHSELIATCHEMVGALAVYELTDESGQVGVFSQWLKTHGDDNPDKVSKHLNALLEKLEQRLPELKSLKQA